MTEQERLKREQEFQDARILEEDTARQAATKYYILMQRAREKYNRRILTLAPGRRLLEYGCSDGEATRLWAEQGAQCTGIDISPEAIRHARMRAEEAGLHIRYEVMNAEAMSFDDASFDVVVGTGILHHLELDSAYAEIARVLSDDGHAIFIEPLGHNPLINLYRRLTPAMRSEDEHPLRIGDLGLASRYFGHVNVHYQNLFTFAGLPFRNTRLFPPLHGFLRGIDAALFTVLPFTKRMAWLVYIECSQPVRNRIGGVQADNSM
ncbi:MAG: class I SAM-dependent methyltransferase [Bacteroidetes bacterium]|nr:class I SAM-dependent methyltransferase [Bacteroidota bacterium]